MGARSFHFTLGQRHQVPPEGRAERVTKMVDEDNLESTYPYLDDVTIAANSLAELRENSKRFEESCKKRNMTINESKSIREADCLNILGYQIKHQQISPDPDRLKPLMDIPIPSTTKELNRTKKN